MKTKSDKVITVVTIDRHAYQQKVMEVLYKKKTVFQNIKGSNGCLSKTTTTAIHFILWHEISLSWTDHIGSCIVKYVCTQSWQIETTGP